MKLLLDALAFIGYVALGVFGMCCIIFAANQLVTLGFSLGILTWRQ